MTLQIDGQTNRMTDGGDHNIPTFSSKSVGMIKKFSSAAVVIGALMVNSLFNQIIAGVSSP